MTVGELQYRDRLPFTRRVKGQGAGFRLRRMEDDEWPMTSDPVQFNLNEATDLLARTPAVIRAMLDGLPDAWVRANYGRRTFSPFDVVGHLIHGERVDWMPRVKIILEHGTAKPFGPFDRYAMY